MRGFVMRNLYSKHKEMSFCVLRHVSFIGLFTVFANITRRSESWRKLRSASKTNGNTSCWTAHGILVRLSQTSMEYGLVPCLKLHCSISYWFMNFRVDEYHKRIFSHNVSSKIPTFQFNFMFEWIILVHFKRF